MKIFCRILGVVCLCLMFVKGVSAQDDKTIIKVIDTLTVDMTRMDTVICMNEKVLLAAPLGDVFACEWIDLTTGDTISKARSIWVSPDSTHQYRLNLYYFSGELIPEGNFEGNEPIQTEYKLGIKNWPDCKWRDGGRFCDYKLYPEGYYSIGTNPKQRDFHPYFFDFRDHTSGHGKMMVVNGSQSPGIVVWETTVNVVKGDIYAFSAWGVEVSDGNPATFHFTINGRQLGENHKLKDLGQYGNQWEQFYQLWEADDDVAKISLVNLSVDRGGNDFAIDDISFASMKKETGVITVQVLPSVKLGHLSDMSKCEGTSVQVNAKATGTDITAYKWEKDGEVLAETGALLKFASLALTDAGNYRCSVTGRCGTREEFMKIEVLEKLKIGQLRDTVWPCEGRPVTFEATAGGYLPKYQWTRPKGSQGWLGDKEAIYKNDKIVWKRDTGVYTCKITNICGSETVYRVLLPHEDLKITDWPGNLNVCAGSDVRLYAGTNMEPKYITWGGHNMSGRKEGKELWLRNVENSDAGSYNCMALDECLAGDYKVLVLQVIPRLTGLQVSKDTVVCENGKAVFRVKADGVKVKYNWSGPGGFTANTSEIVIDPVSVGQIGTYWVTAIDSCGNTLTEKVELSLKKEYDLLGITGNMQVCPNEMVCLEVTGGGETMTYDWTLPNGSHSMGATITTKAVAGEYVCKIRGICPAIEKSVVLSLKERLKAETGIDKYTVCPGENVRFVASAVGENIVCEWWKGTQKVGDGEILELNRVEAGNAGIYDCRISSACGDTVLHYELSVKELLKITDHTSVKYVRRGEKTSLFVNVSGENERKYAWLTGKDEIPGATGNRLEIEAPNRDTLIKYTCVVTACNIVSVEIPVFVRDYQTITKDTSVLLCEGMDYSYRIQEKPEGWCENSEITTRWTYNGKNIVSEGNALSILSFSDSKAGEYVCTRESKCGKETVRLSVNALERPEILSIHCEQGTQQDGVIVVCTGDNVQLIPEIKSTAPLAYEWSKDGVVIPDATDRVLTLPDVTDVRDGRYSLRVISSVCGEDTKEINLEVYKKLTITYLPEIEECPGESVLLQVKADASVKSNFVWTAPDHKGWATETDGYLVSYSNASVQPSHSGLYHCEVTNVCGTATADILLSIEKEIILPDMVQHDTVCPGETKILTIPSEQAGVKFAWILPDKRVVEQQAVVIEHFSVSDTGTYRYRIQTKNSCFDIEESLTLHMRPGIQNVRISSDTALCEGQGVSFSAFAEGKEIKYEWWGPQYFRADGPTIQIDPVEEKSSGIYEVVVTDICNLDGVRKRVNLSLLKEFENLSITKDTGVCEGDNVDLKVLSDRAGLHYEWMRKEQIAGRDSVLKLKQVKAADAGKYICRVSGICQIVEREVNVQVFQPLMAQKEEIMPVCVRENATLNVSAIGEQVKYRWVKGGEEKGYRTNQLPLLDVIPENAGIYECQVNSLCGDTVLYYNFQLKENTRITRHSANRILCEGDEYQLWVETKGTNLQYSWTCDGIELAEKDSLIVRNAPSSVDTLVYTCTVQGDCGIDSVSILVKVGEYHRIRTDLNDTLCQGSNYKYNVTAVPLGAFEGQGFNYRWTYKGKELMYSTSPIFSLSDVQPEWSGDYFCEITTLPEITEPKSRTIKLHIEVVRLPEIESITDDIYVVEGSHSSIKVVANGSDLAYSWKKDGEITEHISPIWDFIPVEYEDRGEYEVTVANQCSEVKAKTNLEVWRKTVIVYPQERTDSVCLKDSIDLQVVAWGENGLLYKWYKDDILIDVPFTQPLQFNGASVEDAGLYVCVVSGRGGTDTCKIHLNVLALPKVQIDGRFRLCQDEIGNILTYKGSSNEDWVDYNWKVESGVLSAGINWGETMVRWGNSSDAALTLKVVSLATGCANTKTEEIKYIPQPQVNISVPSIVGYCRDTLKLDRAYPWGGIFTVNGAPAEVIHFADKNSYYAIEYYYADSQTGCGASVGDTIRIAVAPVVRIEPDTVRTGWCAPAYLKVGQHSEGDIVWGGTQTPVVVDPLQMSYQSTSSVMDIQKFWAVLTDEYQCQDSDTSFIVLLPSPEVKLMKDTTIGVCNELILHGFYDVVSPQKVEWKPTGNLNEIDGYTAELRDKKIGDNQFILAVTDQYGCIGEDTVVVTVKEGPLLEEKETCVGNDITIDAGTYSQYSWEDGYEGSQRVLSKPGTYYLEVIDHYGCKGEASYNIHSLPVVHLEDTIVYEGQKMEFEVEDNIEYPPYEVKWQDGTTGKLYVADKEGYYNVKVMDNIGCSASDTAYLAVKKWYIAAPDAFLPSSQGENSKFYLKEVNFGSHFEMYIYDRWGELLFKTDEIGYKGGWNGTFKGVHCQPGAYVWVAFVDGKEVGRGTLMLVK